MSTLASTAAIIVRSTHSPEYHAPLGGTDTTMANPRALTTMAAPERRTANRAAQRPITCRHRIEQVTVVQIAPAEFVRRRNVMPWETAPEPAWHAGIEKNPHRSGDSSGCDGLREERGLRLLEDGDGMFAGHAREIARNVVRESPPSR
jgi:hypothetical protein